jgi:hypothetical protein
MTRDDIVRLREECDQRAEWHLQCVGEYHPDFHTVSDERFAALVAAAAKEEMLMAGNDQWLEEARKAEREACAKVCESKMPNPVVNWSDAQIVEALRDCAAAIRARGQA